MKGLENKKGFTLVELLAVIVVLAIVMVLATTTVLPYMTKSTNNAFAIEANGAIDAASQAMSLISIGSIPVTENDADFSKEVTTDAEGNVTGTKYCFSLKKLVDLGLLKKDVDEVNKGGNYAGTVVVTETTTSKAFSYAVEMHNKDLYVKNSSGTVDGETDVLDYTEEVDLKTSCTVVEPS